MRNEMDDNASAASTSETEFGDQDFISSSSSAQKGSASPAEKPRVVEDVLIEEVSIDGMCGVY